MQRKFILRTTAVILLLLCSLPSLAASSYWQTANPLSDDITDNGNLTLYRVYYSGSEVIAVGERGAILTGTNTNVGFNRVKWVARQSGLTIDLNDVIYDGTRYLAIGGRTNGVILASPDLVNWQTRIVGDNIRLRGIAHAMITTPGSSSTSRYVVVGDNGGLLTSTDGATWTTLDSGTGMPLLDVLWDSYHKQFIAVGGNTTTGLVLRSPDGETWSQQIVGGHFLHDIGADGAGKLIIVGDAGTVVSSSDGVSWSTELPPTDQDLYGVAYSSTFNNYVAVGTGGTILYSSNGSTWTPSTSGTTNNLYSVTWDGSHFVVVGTNTLLSPTDSGLSSWKFGLSPISDTLNLTGIATDSTTDTSLAVTDSGDVYSSSDGLAWTQVASATGHTFTAVAWDGSRYVAIDNGSDVLTSADGTSWTLQAAAVGSGLNGIAYGDNGTTAAYVIVGDGDTLLVSIDLVNWTPKSWSPAGSIGNLAGVTFNADANNNAGEFLVIANRVISTNPVQYDVTVLHSSSAAGLAWSLKDPFLFSPTTPLTTPLNTAAWNGSQYVAVGPTGNILFSDDGDDWQHPERPDTIKTFNGISWAAALKRFIAVGNSGTVMLSAGTDMGVFMSTQGNAGTIATEFEPYGYSFTAINNGPFRATNIVMTVTLPAATDAEFGTFDGRCTQSGQILTCPLADMAGGGGVFTSLYIQVTPLSPLVHTDLAVTADVTAAGPEALPNDNSLTTATYVQSTEDKIAKEYNSKLGGTGRLDAAGLLVLALAMLPLWRRRQQHHCRG